MCAGRFDHPLDPGQMRRQMATVAPDFAGRIRALGGLQRGLGLFLCGLKHALRQLHIFPGQVELVRRQLLGALAELLALRRTEDALQPAIGFLNFGQSRLDLGQTGFQQGVLAGKSIAVHGRK